MKRRSLKKIIFTLALVFISALFVVLWGVSINNSARSFIEANAAEDKTLLVNNLGLEIVGLPGDKEMWCTANITVGEYYKNKIGETEWKRYGLTSTYTNTKTVLATMWTTDINVYTSQVEFSNHKEFSSKIDNWSFIGNANDIPAGSFEINNNAHNIDTVRRYCFVAVLEIAQEREEGEITPYKKEYKVIAKSPNYIYDSYSNVAKTKLMSGVLDDESVEDLKMYRSLAGYSTEDKKIDVKLKYRGNKTGNLIPWEAEIYQVDNLKSLSKSYVWAEILQACGKSKLSDFNITRLETWSNELSGSKTYTQLTETITAANGYEYDPDTLTLTITYNDFNAEQFPIVVNTNDDLHSVILYRSDSIVTENGKTVIIFDTDELKTQLTNNFGWEEVSANFNEKENGSDIGYTFTVNSDKIQIKKTYTEDDLGNKYISAITLETTDQNALLDCDIRLEIQVVPPVEETVTVYYTELKVDRFTIDKVSKKIVLKDKIWSYNVTKLQSFEAIQDLITVDHKRLGDILTQAIRPAELRNENGKDLNYCNFYKFTAKSKNESETGSITVEYTYRPIFAIYDTYTESIRYMSAFDETTVEYDGSYFITKHDGYRVKSIVSGDNTLIKVIPDKEHPDNWSKAKVRALVQMSGDDVLPITVTYTDLWKVRVIYLQNYTFIPSTGDNKGKETASGFAEKKVKEKEVKLSVFKDIYNPTEDELKDFLNFQSLTVIGTFGAWDKDNTTITYEDDIYTIELAYPGTTIKITQSDGTQELLRVPLTSFAEWTKSIGKDWSILALNYSWEDEKTGKKEVKDVFKSEVDVKPENLYGYFYISVFTEQVKDLNRFFDGYNAEGCRVFFKSKEIKGNELYKVMSENRGLLPTIGAGIGAGVGLLFGKPISGAVIGAGAVAAIQYSILSLSEIANNENATYYSYFSFIDGSSTLSYARNNNADPDDPFNDNSATDNVIDKATKTIKNLFEKVTSNERIEFIFWAIIGLIGYAVAYKFLTLTGLLNQPMFKWVWFGLTIVLLGIALYFGLVAFGAVV